MPFGGPSKPNSQKDSTVFARSEPLSSRVHQASVLIAKPSLLEIRIDRERIGDSIARRVDVPPDVTFFVGENGSGKSTLLEAIAMGFGPEGGTNRTRAASPT